MKTILGVDVSKDKLDCAWLRELEPLKVKSRVFANTTKGHKELVAWAQDSTGVPAAQLTVLMEATGVYHEALAYELHSAGVEVVVLNPARVRDYAGSLAVRTKNDRKDSVVLARFGHTQPWQAWEPEPPSVRQLRALVARLDAIDKDVQRERNRLEKAQVSRSSQEVEHSIESMLASLNAEKARLEKLIDDHIDRHPGLKNDAELLRSIPGVGPVLTRHMLAVYHARRFDSARQMAAYCGLVPVEHQSGSSVRKRPRLSKAGPATVRAKLYFPAVTATTCNPLARDLYLRLVARGKSKMSALGAVMRQLVHLCFGVLKSQKPFSPTTIQQPLAG